MRDWKRQIRVARPARSTKKISEKSIVDQIIDRATVDPDWFCEEILHLPNDPWQSEMMNAVADIDRAKQGMHTVFNHELHQWFTVAAFHGPGKTHWLAKTMHWYGFTRICRIPCTGPKSETLRTRLWPEFRKVMSKADAGYRKMIDVQATKITWLGNPDHCALVQSAAKPENLAGLHDVNLLYLIDEASADVIDKMLNTVEGALTEPNATLIMIGNPTRSEGVFYNSHNDERAKKFYYKKQIHHDECRRPGLADWAKKMIEKYGRESPVVKVRVFGEFVKLSLNQLYALEWLEQARLNESKADGSHPKYRLSIDVADGGVDETIFTIGKHYDTGVDIIAVVRKSFPAATATIDAVDFGEKLFEVHGGRKDGGITGSDDVVVDGVGVGAGTAAEFVKRGWSTIKHKGGESSSDPKKYRNRRSHVYFVSRDFLRDNRVAILDGAVKEEDWNDFLNQLLLIKTKPGMERVEEIEPKSDLLRGGTKSPDMADSFSMQFATRSVEEAPVDSDSFILASSDAGESPWRTDPWFRD